ncbi:hypothetical protein AAF712_010222 [Marasmius tenuissimus]|uniref:Clr5 domain-containing protein n=1 Tax=Marasmius tenuissimus TaxID=585030 RepID=A0ABR2ZML1_9AGAR
MVNITGQNGRDNGIRPSDDRLRELLHGYAKNRMKLDERKLYLEKEGYTISVAKLKKLNREFGVPTVRKPPPLPVATTTVSTIMSKDLAARNGPNTIQHILRRQHNCYVPRDTIRRIARKIFPHGSEARYPGKKAPTLRMGVSIDIYGARCHTSGVVLLDEVVPNARCSSTIGHLYLDMVEKYGVISEQITVDGGTETGELYACHKALRDKYKPEWKDSPAHPEFVSIPSTKNVIIEGHWNHWLRFAGSSLREAIEQGRIGGYFVIGNEVHKNLFHWLWPRIVQRSLDDFIEYWNNHPTRNHRRGNLPSGVRPQLVYDFPEHFGLYNCGIRVDQEDIQVLRATIPRSREECFRWVPDEFDVAAQLAYGQLGEPELTSTSGWQVFVDMLQILSV